MECSISHENFKHVDNGITLLYIKSFKHLLFACGFVTSFKTHDYSVYSGGENSACLFNEIVLLKINQHDSNEYHRRTPQSELKPYEVII